MRSNMSGLTRSLMLIILSVPAVIGLFACAGAPGDTVPILAPTALPTSVLTPVTIVVTSKPQPAATQPQSTATAQPSPTPCQHPIQPALITVWNPDELGCPITPGSLAINTAYAPFEGGQMLWRGDADLIYVLYNNGKWASYPNEWRAGDPEYTCGEASSPPTPVRGFGRAWCDYPDVRDALGAVTAGEIGDSAGVVQDFVNGTILISPFGAPFVFAGEDGVWRRVEE